MVARCVGFWTKVLWEVLDQKEPYMRVMISAATTKLTIAIRVASIVPSNERKDIIFTLSVLFGVIIFRAAKKIMLNANIKARSLKTKTIHFSNFNLAM